MTSRALPLLALFIAVGIFFAYVRPTWTGPIAEAKAAIESDNAALDAAAQYTMEQNALASERAAIDPQNLARLSILLPDAVDNVGIILDLNALAARSQLTLTTINVATGGTSAPAASTGALPTSGAGATPLGSVDLSLSVAGTYSAFQTFLTSIEKSARLLDVVDTVIKGSETGVYTYQMTLRLYWLR